MANDKNKPEYSNEWLRILFEYAPDAYYLSDLEGNLIDGNRAAESLIGYDKDELIGKSFLKLDLLPPDYIPKAAALLTRNALGKPTGPDEFSLNPKNGAPVFVEIRTYPVNIEGRTLVLSIARDITKRKKDEEELKESAKRLLTVIEVVDEGITFSDIEGHFEVFNSKIREITGYTKDEANSHGDFLSLLYPDHEKRLQAVRGIEEVFQRGISGDIETAIRAKDGTQKTLLVSTSLVRYKNKDMLLSAYRDITKRKQMEDELRKQREHLEELVKERTEELQKAYDELAEFDKMKDDFLATTSHSLKTPITSILSLTQLLNDELSGLASKEQKEDLDTILKESLRLKKLVDDILSMYRLESRIRLEMRDVQLEELINHALSAMKHRADEKGIELVKELHERLPEIRASCDDMQDVLLNLLDNALKFTPNGGKVTVGAKREGSEITAWVVDTGIGIPENEQVKLFSKFSQVDSRLSRSSGGIGLGLAICKKILDAHGGSIWVESRPGKGSTFYFKIKSVSQ